jgi:hypothetical protein
MIIGGFASLLRYFVSSTKPKHGATNMERRQNNRHAAAYDAEVRYHSGRKLKLPVLDISLGGCMVDARSWSIREGETVSVKLPSLSWAAARLVWIEDGKAGIAFEEMLYEPTLEHLNSLGRMAA